MTICMVLQMYAAMAATHVDVVKAHEQIQAGQAFLASECKKEQEKEAKKAKDK